jgi:hypothetical protein
VRQLAKQARAREEFDRWLEKNVIRVEPMTGAQAVRFAAALMDDRRWLRLARDAFIAGHLASDDVVWTTNPDDFRGLGVPSHQIGPDDQGPPGTTPSI